VKRPFSPSKPDRPAGPKYIFAKEAEQNGEAVAYATMARQNSLGLMPFSATAALLPPYLANNGIK